MHFVGRSQHSCGVVRDQDTFRVLAVSCRHQHEDQTQLERVGASYSYRHMPSCNTSATRWAFLALNAFLRRGGNGIVDAIVETRRGNGPTVAARALTTLV